MAAAMWGGIVGVMRSAPRYLVDVVKLRHGEAPATRQRPGA
jgi:hypothetical protein